MKKYYTEKELKEIEEVKVIFKTHWMNQYYDLVIVGKSLKLKDSKGRIEKDLTIHNMLKYLKESAF